MALKAACRMMDSGRPPFFCARCSASPTRNRPGVYCGQPWIMANMAAVRHGAPVCQKLRRLLYRIRRISSSSARGAMTMLANTSSAICSGLASGGNMAKVCSIIGRPSFLQSQVAGSVTSAIAGYRTSSVIVICTMHSRSDGILPGILKVVLKP